MQLLLHLQMGDGTGFTETNKKMKTWRTKLNSPPDIVNLDDMKRILKSNFDGDSSQSLSLSKVNYFLQNQDATNWSGCEGTICKKRGGKSQKRKKSEWPTPNVSTSNNLDNPNLNKSPKEFSSSPPIAEEKISNIKKEEVKNIKTQFVIHCPRKTEK